MSYVVDHDVNCHRRRALHCQSDVIQSIYAFSVPGVLYAVCIYARVVYVQKRTYIGCAMLTPAIYGFFLCLINY